MDLAGRLRELERVVARTRFRVETVARVGKKLGVHKDLRWAGAQVLLRELSKGKASPSLIFRLHAANHPERTALVQAIPANGSLAGAHGGRRMLSYRELDETIDRLGLALSRRGMGRGSRALLLLKNRIEFIIVEAAMSRIGGSVVTASWRSTVPEIEYLVRHSGARIVFFDADIEAVIRELADRLEDLPRSHYFSVGGELTGFLSFEELIAGEYGKPPESSDESSIVMYTSGTTGKPKGAVRSIKQEALAMALGFIGETPMQLGEVHLTSCPLYHATAFGFSSFTLLLGGTVVVMSDFKPEPFLDAVQRYRVNSAAIVPTMLYRILELGDDVIRRYDLSSLRAFFSGGAPLSSALALEAMDRLGDVVFNFYGATETGLVSLAKPRDLRASPGTIGRPVPGCDVRIVDEQGHECSVGHAGELYAFSPMLVDGYHADPEATQKSMLEGFFSVGDLARRDESGCIHIEGRKRDMIISGGVNVYPAEVEGVLHEHPAVAEAAVIGVPDSEWGERVRAFIVRRPVADVTDDELKAHCRARLAGPKVPRDFVFLESLPRNPTGKVLKRDLRQMEIG